MEPDNFSALAAVGLANAAVCQEIDSLPRILVIHGRSPDKDDVAELVRDAGATPVVMQDEFVSGNTISAEFERLALQVDGAVVVVTPDDEGRATRTPDGTGFIDGVPTLRARQNVILEYGWSWCRFGRAGVALLVRGEVELPSDIADVLHHRYVSSPREISDRIDQFVGRFSDSRM